MENFTFQNTTRIIFGRGTQKLVGEECCKHAKKVLLHFGGQSIKKSGLYDEVIESLNKAGVEYVELGGVQPNPRLSLVHKGVSICRAEGVELILAVGGGSVIDSAKAIAMGVPYSGDVWDFYTHKATPAKALPVATVLTIPAAGSESSDSSVITNEDGWRKHGYTNGIMTPLFSILNPELAFTLPKYQVAAGATDIMSHLMERYFTNSHPVELTDGLIEATLRNMVRNVPKVLAKMDDYDAWAEVMWSGCVAHNNLLDTGRIGDWASHGIEHELSALYDVAHGAGLAVVFPAWMRHVYKHNLGRFVRFAVEVWGVRNDYWNPEATALAGIQALQDFLVSIGMPATLKQLDIPGDHIDEMAAKATNHGQWKLGNFVKLGKEDIAAILRSAQ
ncbi:MAG: iron-containing alcohol dehydrogenase [Opitutales bacterium]|nr:iron-containing alcohol dehydrogenase [Opitutales bacterium]